MTSPPLVSAREAISDAFAQAVRLPLQVVQLLLAQPSAVFLVALTAMLFRPPDLQFYSLDRIAFGLLVIAVGLRAACFRKTIRWTGPATWPMLALVLLSLAGVLNQPFDAERWSLLAARWIVPFALYQMAGLVFDRPSALRHFETFCLVVLAYLSFIAIAFLLGYRELIWPRFILSDGIGVHADRARGPFLQAVANGVTLNVLGIVALDAFRRGRLRGMLAFVVLGSLPLAVLATKTRAVWLAFAGSMLFLVFQDTNLKLRRVCGSMIAVGAIGLSATFVLGNASAFTDRFSENSPVDYRLSVYQSGWNMFLERPLLGWPAADIEDELLRRTSGFRVEAFYFHNTYLQIAVEHGLMGIDASFVGMNYQFVNGLLFTFAGILSAQSQRCADLSATDIPVSKHTDGFPVIISTQL